MHRDLEFHPSTTQSSRTLSTEQVESFNRLGYLKGLLMFDADEIAEHRQFFDRLLADTMAAGSTNTPFHQPI